MTVQVHNFRAPTTPRRARLSVEQYYAICEAGVLSDHERTELINGEIFIMNAVYRAHARVRGEIEFALRQALAGRSDIEVLGEVTAELSPDTAPMPDISISKRVSGDKGIPDGALLLAIEVADTTERRDLGTKRKLYARHGVPEYWVVLVKKQEVVRFAEPLNGDYRQRESFPFGAGVESVTLDGVVLPEGWSLG